MSELGAGQVTYRLLPASGLCRFRNPATSTTPSERPRISGCLSTWCTTKARTLRAHGWCTLAGTGSEGVFPSGSHVDPSAGRPISLGDVTEGLDMQAIFRSALEQNVAFVPGECFYANDGREGARHIRLNFSNATPEQRNSSHHDRLQSFAGGSAVCRWLSKSI